jgi:hypothetical protein
MIKRKGDTVYTLGIESEKRIVPDRGKTNDKKKG